MTRFWLIAPVLFACGCEPTAVTPRPGEVTSPARPELAAAHDPARCGTVAGRVTFAGPVPVVPKLLGALAEGERYTWVTKPNPFTPRVGEGGGLANVLVWIEGVAPGKSKPWAAPPLKLNIQDAEFRAHGKPFVCGVARAGDPLTVTSRDAAFHSLRARGAAFFALPFPAKDAAVTHSLPPPGVVELSDATTAYWMAADVLVVDTPYATTTDSGGNYTFTDVPAGQYTLHHRARNWKATRTERDPETGLIARQYYAAPAVKTLPIVVEASATLNKSAALTPADFPETE